MGNNVNYFCPQDKHFCFWIYIPDLGGSGLHRRLWASTPWTGSPDPSLPPVQQHDQPSDLTHRWLQRCWTKSIWGTSCRSKQRSDLREAATHFHPGTCLGSKCTITLWASAKRRGTGWLADGPKPWRGEMSLQQSLACCDCHLSFKDISAFINI